MKPFLNRRPLLLFLAVAVLIGLVTLCRGLAQDKGLPLGLPAPAAAPDPATGKGTAEASGRVASDLIKWHRDVPGDSAPIILDADQITIWIVGDSQYVLMRGKVLVQQALVQVRCGQAIAWVDRKYYQERKIWHLVLYAEDQVSLDCTTAIKSGTRGLVDLHSRGELKLQSHVNKLEQKNLSSEPLVHRGLELYRETTDLEPERANHGIRQAGSVQRIPEPAVYVAPRRASATSPTYAGDTDRTGGRPFRRNRLRLVRGLRLLSRLRRLEWGSLSLQPQRRLPLCLWHRCR